MQHVTRVKQHDYPDLLRQRVGPYFEKDGLCFAPLLETTLRGACVLAVYFQNRCERRAFARMQFRPTRRGLRPRRAHLSPAPISIDCPGAAFGVVRAPLRISPQYQADDITFDVAADVLYPDGAGGIVRSCAGMPVGSPAAPGARHPLLGALLTLPRGVLDISCPARVTLAIPEGLADVKPTSGVTCEILWLPQILDGEQFAHRRAAA